MNATVTFGYTRKNPIFSMLEFKIPDNEITVLCGHNGAGKTTLLKILSGILPSEAALKESWFVPAGSGLIRHFSLSDHIRMLKATDTELYRAAFELFRAESFYNVPIRQLSTGQSVMASILTAIASKREILLLDEPYASLDPVNAQHLCQLLKMYPGTVVLTSHDLFLTLETSAHIQFLKSGSVSWVNQNPEISIEELRAAYAEFA